VKITENMCDARGSKSIACRFLDIELEIQIREGFSSLKFFNSAGVREFALSCKVFQILMPFGLFDTE